VSKRDTGGIADHQDARLHHIQVRELDIRGGDEGTKGFAGKILDKPTEQIVGNDLVLGGWRRRHGISHTPDDLPAFVVWLGTIVGPGKQGVYTHDSSSPCLSVQPLGTTRDDVHPLARRET